MLGSPAPRPALAETSAPTLSRSSLPRAAESGRAATEHLRVTARWPPFLPTRLGPLVSAIAGYNTVSHSRAEQVSVGATHQFGKIGHLHDLATSCAEELGALAVDEQVGL